MKIITDGAKIKCTLGTKTSSLVVTSQQFSKIENKLIATEGDNKSLSNILSFGNCKRSSHQPPCIPSPIEWTSLTETNKINNKRQLTEKAFCNCSQGGKIEFIDTGANSHVDSE